MEVVITNKTSSVGIQSIGQNFTLSFRKVFFHFRISNLLDSRITITTKNNFAIQLLPSLSNISLFCVFFLNEVVNECLCFRTEVILALIFDKS